MAGPILVTGAQGFVGRHLLAELQNRAVPANADVTRGEDLLAEVRAAAPEAVVHLAAATSVAESWTRAEHVWHVNVVGTVNVLDAVREEAPSARVLVVSTGEVYGDAGETPTRESRSPAPVSPYAASKVAVEVAAERAARVDGIDVVVARPFQHVGPGQDTRFAVGSWTRRIVELEAEGGGTLEVGDLSVERDLLDVRDVCRAYRLLLETSVPGGVYNVASGRPVRLERVVGELVRLARVPVTVAPNPGRFRPADVRRVAGDAARLREVTGWRPEIALETTLADSLEAARSAVADARMSAA